MADFDGLLQQQDGMIQRVGWAVTAVLPTPEHPGAPFAYTVGLTAHGHPELIIAGLHHIIAHALLNDLARRVYDTAARFTHGQRITDLIAGYDAVIVDGDRTEELHPGTALARYGADRVRLQQIVWPDPDGRFPWESGYGYPPDVQPLIGQP